MRVLIQQRVLPHYRVDLFNLLSQHVDLCVVHSGPLIPSEVAFLSKSVYLLL